LRPGAAQPRAPPAAAADEWVPPVIPDLGSNPTGAGTPTRAGLARVPGHGPTRQGAVPAAYKGHRPLPRRPFVPNPKLQCRRRLQTLAVPPLGSRRPPPLRRQEDPREHRKPVRSTPVSLVRVPVPRFAPRALTAVRRRLSSAPPRGPSTVACAPTRVPWIDPARRKLRSGANLVENRAF
jgi:hypothetical protein